jgi:sugar lactone lactonase YvrE
LGQPIDLALEPGKTSVLVSNTIGSLVRVSLAGGIVNSLTLGGRQDGLIYDPSGNLFVNVSTGFTANDSKVERINPTTGAVLQSSANTNVFLDGLTYDSSTGMLFASDYNHGKILRINPTTLATTEITPLGSALDQPDGIVSDGNGNLFIASRGNAHVIEYNIATNTASDLATINGLDDLAPASGLGAPPTPEPSTIVSALSGAIALAWYARRRRKQA